MDLEECVNVPDFVISLALSLSISNVLIVIKWFQAQVVRDIQGFIIGSAWQEFSALLSGLEQDSPANLPAPLLSGLICSCCGIDRS
jgi:hypothetical protein